MKEVIKMKIAVVAANGRAGQKIVAEALSRGLDVTAIVRGENKSAAKNVIIKDILEITKDDLKDFDIIIDAFGTWVPENFPLHKKTSQHLCDLISGTDKRLLIVGGAGTLYTNKEHTAKVLDSPEIPESWLPVINAMGDALAALRKRNDVNWTFISPAVNFKYDGERTGKYILAGEELTLSSKGESVISYADYAIAMIDEATKGNHIHQRISVVQE
jgi:hypothetical protein